MNVWGIILLFVSIVQSTHINKVVLWAIEFSVRGWTPLFSLLTWDSKRQRNLIGLVKIFVCCVDFQIKFKTNVFPSKVNRPLDRLSPCFDHCFLSGWRDNYWLGFKLSRHDMIGSFFSKLALNSLTGLFSWDWEITIKHLLSFFVFNHGRLIGTCHRISGTDGHLCHAISFIFHTKWATGNKYLPSVTVSGANARTYF